MEDLSIIYLYISMYILRSYLLVSYRILFFVCVFGIELYFYFLHFQSGTRLEKIRYENQEGVGILFLC